MPHLPYQDSAATLGFDFGKFSREMQTETFDVRNAKVFRVRSGSQFASYSECG